MDIASPVPSTQITTPTLSPANAPQAITPTNMESALKNAEPTKFTTLPPSPATVYRVWEESMAPALFAPLELNQPLMVLPVHPAVPTSNSPTEYASASQDMH